MASVQASDHKAVFALLSDRFELDNAVMALEHAGFKHADISVLFNDRTLEEKMAHENSTKAPEGIATGAAGGVVIGGALGWLVGIGALAIPGVGPLIAAGPILAAIAGAGLAGTLSGIAGGLVGFGIPEYEAKRYEGLVREGGFLISVHVANSQMRKQATEILENSGAESISTKNEERLEMGDFAAPATPLPVYPSAIP